MREKYIVRLNGEERHELENIVKKLKGTSQHVKRAIVLLKADADGPNWTNEKIAVRTGMTNKAISNLRKKFVIEGFDAVLNRKKRTHSSRPKKLDGKQEAQIIAMRCGTPPEGFGQWSLRLLAERVVEWNIVETISKDTIRRTLKKQVDNSKNSILGYIDIILRYWRVKFVVVVNLCTLRFTAVG